MYVTYYLYPYMYVNSSIELDTEYLVRKWIVFYSLTHARVSTTCHLPSSIIKKNTFDQSPKQKQQIRQEATYPTWM